MITVCFHKMLLHLLIMVEKKQGTETDSSGAVGVIIVRLNGILPYSVCHFIPENMQVFSFTILYRFSFSSNLFMV